MTTPVNSTPPVISSEVERSALPLIWAIASLKKSLRSLHDGRDDKEKAGRDDKEKAGRDDTILLVISTKHSAWRNPSLSVISSVVEKSCYAGQSPAG